MLVLSRSTSSKRRCCDSDRSLGGAAAAAAFAQEGPRSSFVSAASNQECSARSKRDSSAEPLHLLPQGVVRSSTTKNALFYDPNSSSYSRGLKKRDSDSENDRLLACGTGNDNVNDHDNVNDNFNDNGIDNDSDDDETLSSAPPPLRRHSIIRDSFDLACSIEEFGDSLSKINY